MRRRDVRVAVLAVVGLVAGVVPLVVASPAAWAVPPNDSFAAAISVGSVPATLPGWNVDAGAEGGEPAHGPGGPWASVGWSFRPQRRPLGDRRDLAHGVLRRHANRR